MKFKFNVQAAVPIVAGAVGGYIGAKLIDEKLLQSGPGAGLPDIAKKAIPFVLAVGAISTRKPLFVSVGAGIAAYAGQQIAGNLLGGSPAAAGVHAPYQLGSLRYDVPAGGAGVAGAEDSTLRDMVSESVYGAQ